MNSIKIKSLLFLFVIITTACTKDNSSDTKEFTVDFEKFTLDNGLQVIFHIDRSDPVVA